MKTLIIEDEINVRQGFVKMLNTFCPEVTIVGEAGSVKEGLVLIQNTEFDILFLDIHLPDGSGFDLLECIERRDFNVVFVTAYDKYAVHAFNLSAVDYLLKPVSPKLLKNAVAKAGFIQSTAFLKESLDIASNHLSNRNTQSNKIILKDLESLHIVKVEDLIYCKAEGSYTKFVQKNGVPIMTSTNLKEYEKMLEGYDFIRSHHSYLVNLHHILELKKQEGGSLVLSNTEELPISTRKKATILENMKRIFIN